MLNFLESFFESLSSFFSKIWEILTFVFEELTQFYLIVKQSLQFFQRLLGSLPVVFVVFGVAMLVVLIIYVILGRTAGGD